MIRESIAKVVKGENLTESQMQATMGEIFDGRASSAQIAALVTALRAKGETVDEITGAAKALNARALKLNPGNHLLNLERDDINVEGETILETSDNGKEGTRTFNISTATAFVVAGAGIKIVRHGNRAASVFFGAADVLTHLGINLDISTSDVERCIREIGLGFLFTPISAGPMRHVARIREEMGVRTIFNLIGPLTNPGEASSHLLGVYEPSLTEKMTRVLLKLGADHAIVVCGEGTRDEISICGPTRISRLKAEEIETFVVEPEEFGLERADCAEIRGGNAQKNADIIRGILSGDTGPCRNVVVLNAAAAYVAAGRDSTINDGVKRACDVIDSGKAGEKLEALVTFTERCTPFVRKDLE
jgi:anthranilate phosphoribosyltransferase